MDFDYSNETITPDTTNLLTIGGTGGFELPLGTTAQRPITGLSNGAVRYNTDLNVIEGYVNSAWTPMATGSTSITLTGDITGTGVSPVATTLATVNSNTGTFTVVTVNAKGLTTAATNLAATGDVTGTASGSGIILTLATVNASPQTDTFRKITVNGKGLVTATAAVIASDITTALGYTPVNKAGDTMSGALNMGSNLITALASPVSGTDATNKNYVDAAIAGLSWKQSVRAATTTNGTLATAYVNGSTIDSITLSTGDRILIKNQTAQTENGIYIVAASGAPSRSLDADTGAELVGASVYVDQGTSNADTGWAQTTNAPITLGTSNIVWAQFSGSGSYVAGAGLTLTGNTFSITAPVSTALGGTGTSSVPTSGQFLYSGAGTVYAPTTLTSVAVTTFAGGTTGLTPASATSGAITLGGTLIAVNGGTGQSSYAVGDLLYASTTTALSKLADVATGNTLISGGVNTAPAWGKIGLTTHVIGILPIANGGTNSSTALSGSTIMVSNGTSVVQGSAGTTTTVLHGNAAGLPTYGAVSLTADVSGILPLTNGGTNASLTATNGGIVYSGSSALAITAAGTTGQILTSTGAAAPTWATLTNGGLKFYSEFTTAPVNAPSATASQSIALGTGSSASTYGVRAGANGQFTSGGDAQSVAAVLRAITTTAGSGQELFLDGAVASQRLVLSNNSAWTFNIKIVGRRTDATGSIGSWVFTGLIYRDATAGTTTISGVSKTTVARLGVINGVGNDPVISADTTNGSLKVAVSGYGAFNIRWVATVDLAQVIN